MACMLDIPPPCCVAPSLEGSSTDRCAQFHGRTWRLETKLVSLVTSDLSFAHRPSETPSFFFLLYVPPQLTPTSVLAGYYLLLDPMSLPPTAHELFSQVH